MRRTKSPQSPAFAPKAAYSARASASVNVNDVLNRSGPAANPVAGSASPIVVMARTRANRILDIETSCLSARDVLPGPSRWRPRYVAPRWRGPGKTLEVFGEGRVVRQPRDPVVRCVRPTRIVGKPARSATRAGRCVPPGRGHAA